MEDNKNSFSASGDGYNKEEVDAYFLEVRKQFEKLSAENKKLHRDCVHFAKQLKKIQDSGVLNEDIPELKRQNAQYRKEIANLQNQLNAVPPAPQEEPVETVNSDEEDRGYFNTPSDPEPAPQQNGGAVFFDDEPAPQKKPKASKPKKKSHRVLRGFMIFFLVIFIILGVISVVSAAIGHSKSPATTFFGTRAYTVHNNNMAGTADSNDIVFVKRDDYNSLKTGTVIVATPKDRSLAKVDDRAKGNLVVSGDNGKEYTVTQDQYLGVAKYKVEHIGSFVKWAANNAVVYFLVLCVIIAVLILIIAVIPSKKKTPKTSN